MTVAQTRSTAFPIEQRIARLQVAFVNPDSAHGTIFFRIRSLSMNCHVETMTQP